MNFDNILKELEKSLTELFKTKYHDFTNESKKDISEFLQHSKEKLKRWTILLAENQITTDDFEWLLKSQKDLLNLKALQTAGVSKISLGRFKNKIVDTMLNTIKLLIFKT